MYYVFRSPVHGWHNKTLIARSEPLLKECEPHWWLSKPLTKHPERFKFFIDGKGPKFDNYHCGSGIDMYSERMVSIIADSGVHFETFPSDIFDLKTGDRLDVSYLAFHLLEIYPSIDEDKSVLVFDKEEPGAIDKIEKLVLKDQILSEKPLLFRVEEMFNIVLIHEALKSAFEEANLTGNKYVPLNDYTL